MTDVIARIAYRGSVGHRICAVQYDETIVKVVCRFDIASHTDPILDRDVCGVEQRVVLVDAVLDAVPTRRSCQHQLPRCVVAVETRVESKLLCQIAGLYIIAVLCCHHADRATGVNDEDLLGNLIG